MPAIQIALLRAEAIRLSQLAQDPERFVRELTEICEYYSDRTYRRGEAGAPPPRLPAYRVPPQVMRQILLELQGPLQADPNTGLILADQLWRQRNVEACLLAAQILGCLPPNPPEPVLNRISLWASPGEEALLLDALLSPAQARLPRELPEVWLDLVRGWLHDPRRDYQALGVRALLVLIRDPGYTNLPAVFRLLSVVLPGLSNQLAGDILQVISALADRSPAETAYYLKLQLNMDQGPLIARLVRKALPLFAEPLQTNLRTALLERARREEQ